MRRMTARTYGRAPALCIVALVATALAHASAAAPAFHLQLTRSSPADGAELTEPPAQIRLWFSETPEHAVSMIRLEGAGGEVELGEVRAGDEDSLIADVVGTVAAGDYTVTWRTSSGDGHPVRGSFTFALATTTR